jgi:hypothetical protein
MFLFVALGLYALDLLNSRDGIAVGVWIGAFGMTIASGFGTLLQVDDSSSTGVSMINFLLQLSVEGMSFCTWVSEIIIRNVAHRLKSIRRNPLHRILCIPSLRALSNYSNIIIGILDHTAISMVIC